MRNLAKLVGDMGNIDHAFIHSYFLYTVFCGAK